MNLERFCRQTYDYLEDSHGTQPANSSFETQTCTTLDHGHHLLINELVSCSEQRVNYYLD
jgi:hypothetical protein